MNDEQEERERNFLFTGMELSDEEREKLYNSDWFKYLIIIIFIILEFAFLYYYKFPYKS